MSSRETVPPHREEVPHERPIDRDLGFGNLFASRPNFRLLNNDGSFNVRRRHDGVLSNFFGYHTFLNLSWPRFFGVLTAYYLGVNIFFALGYLACGPNALAGQYQGTVFWRAYFFSIHTFATVGYGNIVPLNFAANALVTFQSLAGLLSLAVATGLVFARFSRPNAKILYSNRALMAPYQSGTSFQFRLVNGRRTQLMNVRATLMHSRFELDANAKRVRRFYTLSLERDHVVLFPASWTVVHPINEDSPLHGWDRQKLLESEAEFYALITAVDESYAQTVYSRVSYTVNEIDWGRKFRLMFFDEDNEFVLDLELLNETYSAPLPEASDRLVRTN